MCHEDSNGEMTFSLIIPHHNNLSQLSRLLATVPQRDDLQVITVEDKEQRGAGWARNQGLKLATGNYIIFADSDDWFLPEFTSLLDSLQGETADVTYFSAISVEEDTGQPSRRTDRLRWIMEQEEEKREFLLRHTFTEPWCHIIRRAMIEERQIRFDETPILNDVTFITQCGYYAESITVHNIKAYCVCNHQGSTGKLRSEERMIAYTKVMAKMNRFNQKHGINYYDARMLRPLLWSILRLKFRIAAACVKQMENEGYTRKEIARLLATYPMKLAEWLINKRKYGKQASYR